jgi:hypothetical protein
MTALVIVFGHLPADIPECRANSLNQNQLKESNFRLQITSGAFVTEAL